MPSSCPSCSTHDGQQRVRWEVRNAYLVYGCGGIPFPHFERFGSSQPWKPDPADLVPSEAVVKEQDGIIVDGLRSGRSITTLRTAETWLTHPQILEKEPGRIKSRSSFRCGELHLLSCFDSLDLGIRILVRAREFRRLKVDDKIVFGGWVRVQNLLPRSAGFALFRERETYRDILETIRISMQ